MRNPMLLLPVLAAGGVIDNAPTLGQAFVRLLNFLLEIFGFLVILAFVAAGVLYVSAGGDANRLGLAKKAFLWSIVGVIIGLGALAFVRAIASFLL